MVLLAVAEPGVVFSTYHLWLVAVVRVVAYVPQGGSPCRLAVAGSFQTSTDVPREANVDPLLPLS
jgi:hypothetical protein